MDISLFASGEPSAVPYSSLHAAISFGDHYGIIEDYDRIISDIMKRESVISDRMRPMPGNGELSNFIEQTTMTSAMSVNPRNLQATTPGAIPTRRARAVRMKAIAQRFQTGVFDNDLTMLPNGLDLRGKDFEDSITSMILHHGQMLWTGTDTFGSYNVIGDNATLQYVGIPYQMTTTPVVVAPAAEITKALRNAIAVRLANNTYRHTFSAIYAHPLLVALLEEEWKANDIPVNTAEITPGVTVSAIRTAAGVLPIITDSAFLTNPSWAAAPGVGNTNYPFVIVEERLIEYHYIGSPIPRVFTLGRTSTLNDDTMMILFGAPVVKLGDITHIRGVVERPTIS